MTEPIVLAHPDPEGPAPRLVVHVDLDGPDPVLTGDGSHTSAMAIGYRQGIPLGTVDFALTDDPADAVAALAPLHALVVPDRGPADVDVAPDHLPGITVVVCSIVNREDDLRLLLETFAAIDYPKAEFVLVDNRPIVPADDPLPGILEVFPGVRLVHEPRPGLSTARNAGVRAARNEVVVFTDDDVRVNPDWLHVIGRRFAQPDGIDALSGLILPAELETPAQIWFEGYYGGFAGERTFAPLALEAVTDLPGPVRGSLLRVTDARGAEVKRLPIYGVGAYGAGANMAFRRSALTRIRGFDDALGTGTPAKGGEDLAANIDVLWTGGRLAFEPRAVVHHKHREDFPDLEKQLTAYGLGFTAMLTSLITRDPRHLVALGWQVPTAAARLGKRAVDRLRGRSIADTEPETPRPDLGDAFPKSLVSTELRGFPQGPGAYFRSRRRWLDLNRKQQQR
ncbi:glycosyltransferase family 2 protein [Frondihabitans cladoniiphilus]|uniref:Glycosyltransferase 2-like domain-containing protein n=1 Tax=Frondihabitans cladoniiphilus TaxID=715785 RepID=A0ABP8W8C0_9MICO